MIVHPNAKINIGLNIIEKRADGYHNIQTVFYPIGLNDTLSVEKSTTCSDFNFSSSGIRIGGNVEDNLIIKAYRLLQQDFDLPPIDIALHKQIPFGAGLGGGSSDAASMLKVLNELFQLNITQDKLKEYASHIGADCSFFIDNLPSYATEIGTNLTPIELSLKDYFILLVKPDIFISTQEAYSGVKPSKPKVDLIELIQQPIESWKESIINDFESHIFHLHPQLKQIKTSLYEMGALYASMSGSGSTIYGIFANQPFYNNQFDEHFVVGGFLD